MTRRISQFGDWMLSQLVPAANADASGDQQFCPPFRRDPSCDSWCGGAYYQVCYSRMCNRYDTICRIEY